MAFFSKCPNKSLESFIVLKRLMGELTLHLASRTAHARWAAHSSWAAARSTPHGWSPGTPGSSDQLAHPVLLGASAVHSQRPTPDLVPVQVSHGAVGNLRVLRKQIVNTVKPLNAVLSIRVISIFPVLSLRGI